MGSGCWVLNNGCWIGKRGACCVREEARDPRGGLRLRLRLGLRVKSTVPFWAIDEVKTLSGSCEPERVRGVRSFGSMLLKHEAIELSAGVWNGDLVLSVHDCRRGADVSPWSSHRRALLQNKERGDGDGPGNQHVGAALVDGQGWRRGVSEPEVADFLD